MKKTIENKGKGIQMNEWRQRTKNNQNQQNQLLLKLLYFSIFIDTIKQSNVAFSLKSVCGAVVQSS